VSAQFDPRRAAPEAVREFLRRLSAAGALAVALVSLLQHTPVWIACARGVATLVLLGFGTRFGVWALARALDFDHAARVSKEEAKP
jgi:hypothetical protein